MITLEEAKKKVISEKSNMKIVSCCEFKNYYVFCLGPKEDTDAMFLVDPIAVDKETEKWIVFNPMTVDGDDFNIAMALM